MGEARDRPEVVREQLGEEEGATRSKKEPNRLREIQGHEIEEAGLSRRLLHQDY